MQTAFITSAYITNEIQLNMALKAIESAGDYFKICVINHTYNHDAYLKLQKANDIIFKNDKNIQARAWNKGIDRAIEEGYTGFLIGSHDILLADNYIETLEKLRGLCAGVSINSLTQFHLYEPQEKQDEITNHDQSFAAFYIDKETYKKVGRFDEQFEPNYFEDDDYLIRAKNAGIKTIRTFNTYFYHQVQAVIKTDQKESEKYAIYLGKNREKYINKWGGLPGYETNQDTITYS